MFNRFKTTVFMALLGGTLIAGPAVAALTPSQQLGELLYFDTYLSLNANQACASCHLPPGFADPRNAANPSVLVVSEGSVGGLFGGRNAPTASYAAFSPFFHWDGTLGMFVGGQFWDGRAATLTAQAMGPFLNPVEMAMPDKRAVLLALRDNSAALNPANPNWGRYLLGFADVYGINLSNLDLLTSVEVDRVYELLATAIGDFEKSYQVNTFTSKYDGWLAGIYRMTPMEQKGMKLFNGKGKCNLCHLSAAGLAPDGLTQMPPLFTDFTYDNLGIPKSTNPLLAGNSIDYGLGARLEIAAYDPVTAPDGAVVSGSQAGKFKVSTLRNIALTSPYGHNGYFATLKEIVHFYNTAAIPGLWPPPEVALNVNRAELGNLNLTASQEDDLVAFMLTLSDGFLAQPVAPAFPFPPFP